MFDINNSIFGYINKSSDITQQIISYYKDSLIFIGDEQQIYIPTTNSYVGSGLSNTKKLYISDIANGDTSYYIPVLQKRGTNEFEITYVAWGVEINPYRNEFIGRLRGTATCSLHSHISYTSVNKNTENNSTYYITFSNKYNNDEFSYSYVNYNLQYNPSTKTLSSSYFKGYLDGRATYATYSTYSTYTTYTIYSTYNTYQSIHNNNINKNFKISFVDESTYSLTYIDSDFLYNPALNCAYIDTTYGNLYGTANNADKLDGKHINELFTAFTGGTISSSANILTQSAHSITIGGVQKSAGESNNVKIINSANWSYVGSLPYTNTTYNLVLRYKVNDVDSSYAYIPKLYAHSATYIDGISAYGLFTQFDNAGSQTTRITIGTHTRELKIDADKVDGFEASGLLQSFTGGGISSSGNILTQSNHTIKIGNTEKSAGESNNVKIINSLSVSKLESTLASNLTVGVTVNGVTSADKTLTDLYARDADKLDGKHANELFTQFENADNQKTRITIGGTTYEHNINADTLDGYHANGLFTSFTNGGISSSGNVLTQSNHSITIGGTTYSAGSSTANIINSLSVSKLESTMASNLTIGVTVNGVASADKKLTDLYARDADKLDGKHANELFTQFNNGDNQKTRITIGGTTYEHNINADTLDGYHANGLFTYFGNSGNDITATIGGVPKTFTVNYATNSTYSTYSTYQSIYENNTNKNYYISFANNTSYSLSYIDSSLYYNPYLNSLGHGTNVSATSEGSHAEGGNTIANSKYSHAEGNTTTASGESSHAEGNNTIASGKYSHAEGNTTTANKTNAHAEGNGTTASGESSHAEGIGTEAKNKGSHAEGNETIANADYSHAEGIESTTTGKGAHAEGNKTEASGQQSHAEGSESEASGKQSHAEGFSTLASADNSHAEGNESEATNNNAHAEGYKSNAAGKSSHAEGSETDAISEGSHAEGCKTYANGQYSHAEGYKSKTNNKYAHAEGDETIASGESSHAEGRKTTASGLYSHAEGDTTTASGDYSHASGCQTKATSDYTFAIGYKSQSNSMYSFAGGNTSITNGQYNFAFGNNIKTSNENEVSFGKYNKTNSDTVFSIGGGTSSTRSNLLEVTTSGLTKSIGGFNKVGYDDNYVLLAGGGHKQWVADTNTASTIVSRNSSGDIIGRYFISNINFDTTSTIGGVFVGTSTDNYIRKITLERFAEIISSNIINNDTVSFTKSLKVTEAWMDTGITTAASDFPKGNGTYAVQISHSTLSNGTDSWAAMYSGIMTIYTGTDSTTHSEEVILHRSGHESGKRLYLRVMPTGRSIGYCKIQIAAESDFANAGNITFKFRKLI